VQFIILFSQCQNGNKYADSQTIIVYRALSSENLKRKHCNTERTRPEAALSVSDGNFKAERTNERRTTEHKTELKRNSKSYQMIRRSIVSVTHRQIYNVVKEEEVKYTQKCQYRCATDVPLEIFRTIKRTWLLRESTSENSRSKRGFVCTELSNRQR